MTDFNNDNSDDSRRVWHDDDYQSDANRYSASQNNRNEEVRKIVREEFRRNYKEPKTPFWKNLLIGLIGAVLGVLLVFLILNNRSSQTDGTAQSNNNFSPSTKIEVKESDNVENAVAKKATPSVVGITTVVQNDQNYFSSGSDYVEGVGSGVILSQDGYIITNSHVVSDGKAETISVLFEDGSSADGQLLWSDQTLDLAIVKVDKTGLTPIELADSDKVEVGDKAIAIGNPLGLDLQSTLTSGYISGLNRTVSFSNGLSMEGMLQTDAAINSGNSGGALLNSKGQLMGINTAKASSSDGIGFAIPINTAKPIIDSVKKDGSFELVSLDMSGVNVATYAQYTQRKLPVEKGVIVTDVLNAGAAEKAGLRKSDIIVGIDDKEIDGMSSLKKAILNYKVGDTVEVTLYRDGKKETAKLTFQQTSDQAAEQYEDKDHDRRDQDRGGRGQQELPDINPFPWWFLR